MADFISEVNKRNAKEKKKEIVLEEKRRKEDDEFNLARTKFKLEEMFKTIVDAYADMPKNEDCLEESGFILFRSDDGEIYGKIEDKYFASVSNYECVNALGLSFPKHVLIFSSPVKAEIVRETGGEEKFVKIYDKRSVLVLKSRQKKAIYEVDGEHRYMLIRDAKFDNMEDTEILETVKKNVKSEYQRSIACKVDAAIKARKALKNQKKKD